MSDEKLLRFYAWFDGVIRDSADGLRYAQNTILDNIACVSPRIANLTCDMHEHLPRRNFNSLVRDTDPRAIEVLKLILDMYSERDSQLVCDSLLHLVKYAQYEDEGARDANSRINTAEMLFDKLDPQIIAYVKASRPNIPTGSAD